MEQTYNTDTGNGERFIAYYGDNVRYVEKLKTWIQWTPEYGWKEVEGLALTKPVARQIYEEAKNCDDPNARLELGKWATKAEGMYYREKMIKSAEVDGMKLPFEAFDANPKVICCTNGVIDLTTKQLLEPSAKQLHLKRVNATYNPDTKCHRWLQFLNEIFDNNQELIDYIQVASGYSILGLTVEHCFFICHGTGRNGKGTLLETILHILGDYGHSTDVDAFLMKDNSTVRSKETTGRLKGKRYAIASETKESARLDESLIKKITGGDTLTGAKLYGDQFEFSPSHTLWFNVNHLPVIKDATPAIWRRIKLIPFRRTFAQHEIDLTLPDTLITNETDGIFNWLVEGAYMYLQSGLKQPDVITEAVEEYRQESDKLWKFIQDKLEKTTPDQVTPCAHVYPVYDDWRENNNADWIHPNYFANKIGERVQVGKREIGKVIYGYKLK